MHGALTLLSGAMHHVYCTYINIYHNHVANQTSCRSAVSFILLILIIVWLLKVNSTFVSFKIPKLQGRVIKLKTNKIFKQFILIKISEYSSYMNTSCLMISPISVKDLNSNGIPNV